MKMKKRIVSLVLILLMSISTTTTTTFAKTKNPLVESNNTTVSQSLLKTIDGQEIKIPDSDKFKDLNNKASRKVRAFSANNYDYVKSIADFKASILTLGYGCTSVQYALIDNGNIVLSGNSGVYSKENNEPITADNMYGIASISKMFTTTAIMQLVEKGLVDLDAPVTKYVGDFKMADKRYKKITVRMLLNHSSGLMGSSLSNALLFDDNDTYAHDTFLKQLRTQRLKADPGAYSVYCNDGFTLAEIVVERVTGNSFTSYITNNIINTLNMNNTKTPVSSEFDRNKLAKTYTYGNDNALPVENFNTIGAGGLYSSAEDLCKFSTTFTNESNGILSKDSLKAMENKEYLKGIWTEDGDNILSYGLGWDSVNLYPFNQYNIKALAKGGDSHLYHSSLIVLPEKNMAMAVVTSGGASTYNEVMAQEVLLNVLKAKGEINDILPDKTFGLPEKVEVPENVKDYEGAYASSNGMLNVEIDKSGIMNLSYLQLPQYGAESFYYTKEGVFKSQDGSQSIKFVKESNGKTYLQQSLYATLPYLGQTAMNLYMAQKEELNELTESVAKAWQKRDGKRYYVLNEKYSSYLYTSGCPRLQVSFAEGLEGYLGLDKIVDENSAISILDGPGDMSRDGADYTFYTKGNYEYLKSNGNVFVEEAAIKTLPTKKKFQSVIKGNGYANWYKIDDKSADKEISVCLPENAAFAVYDAEGMLVNNSLLTGITDVKLPKDGTIVFLGNPYDTFTVRYKIVR